MPNKENNPKSSKTTIPELIDWIDLNEKKLIKRRHYLLNWKGTLLFASIVLFIVVEALNFLTSTNFDKVFTLLTLLVIFLAFGSIVAQTSEQTVAETRLRIALKLRQFEETEKPLLKALIKIKSENQQFKLATLYALDKEAEAGLFTEKGLLGLLCR